MERLAGYHTELKGAQTVTLDEAVKILNDRLHHGHSRWYTCGITADDLLVRGEDQYDFFTPFEAIAIAEKYASLVKTASLR